MTKKILSLCCFILFVAALHAQEDAGILTLDRIYSGEFRTGYLGPFKWFEEGEAYTKLERSASGAGQDLMRYDSRTGEGELLIASAQLVPTGSEQPLDIADYDWSTDQSKLLIFTNTERVWRANTRGDYWVYDRDAQTLTQLGADLPESSLMFAKFAPDGKSVAYVSKHNIYVESLDPGNTRIRQLTTDGTEDIINGTFDWAYEEEFSCRDGFRWSYDGRHIAFWQIDATDIKDFLMINNTDSIYSQIIPVQYPKVGETPSSAKIGNIELASGDITWMDIPGDPYQHYLPRMQWVGESHQLLIQQLNRKQNERKIWLTDALTGKAKNIYTEKDEAWVSVRQGELYELAGGKSFVLNTEKDGWRHLYRFDLDGKEQLLTPGDYDLASVYLINEKENYVYLDASPDNPTQRYLYQVAMKNGKKKRLTPDDQPGTHSYTISPNGKFAVHSWSNANTPPTTEFISLPDHKVLRTLIDNKTYRQQMAELKLSPVEFFTITTADGVNMDGRMIKPLDFDPEKKYPILFNVYGEPAGQTARDSWVSLWDRMMAQKGYIIITMDNRGTPSLKGREWRKSIYRKIGIINSRDQAMATREVLKWPFVDPDRIAVWGWSGGGSMTLNLLFRYPELYQTGVSVAPVGNQLLYDNIYQERYMGLPSENREDFIEGSPVTYAKNLEGDLLIVHGTGDDNVHYQNAEVVINELIRHNKQFQMMAYPNRSHGIYEGQNTRKHLYGLITNYITEHTPPGGVEKTAGKPIRP
ncbi:S9 family peptidase [Flavilitoribacter nigricans]|uniref:S9 family peptidase n=1 Tax=Flavilitoribacter nigricans (strain ATCC 23147 / DSM 23189 / NBRC 102662 / NCIMB 1420 / SS-2) TaxID=1122177 RepID=A0A2D0NAB9_FLAN2|nr:S9 family peptidase [Flavilitoribacter nigricans]PHN05461.1 S9 family peptidase [Flavilitoribacter nigricans DSM 23189 = NBRC 102662]